MKEKLYTEDDVKQVSQLIENIIKLQQSQDIEVNKLPLVVDWDYGINERLDDMKKLEVLQNIQRTASVPYKIKAQIISPILNKLVDKDIKEEDIVNAYNEENKMNIEFGEI